MVLATLALVLLLLIPVVSLLGGFLFSLINPEIAAGYPRKLQNDHILSLVRAIAALASAGVAGLGWPLVCFLVIRSKERSS